MEVTLAGGEPFIREDLKEIIGGIVRNRMRFAILSNGTLITDEMAAFLRLDRAMQLRPGLHRRLRSRYPRRHAGEGQFRESR